MKPLLILILFATFIVSQATAAMERVRVSDDHKSFVRDASNDRFTPWGHNYGSVDILQRLAKDKARVERDFAEMKAAGTTVARVHPEMPMLMLGPNQMDPHGIALLNQLLEIAEKAGIYLDVTGLACYRIDQRMAWYDALDEQDRWKAQAFFWGNIARTCAKSPAIFCYCLVNEPVPSGSKSDGWYFGRMGDVEFCQRLTLDAGKRSGDEIFDQWSSRMIDAIRKEDPQHLITLGMFPFPGIYKSMSARLDFVSPHLYPKAGKVEQEIALLKQFDWGKSIVIEETFPLSCGIEDERKFLLQSRGIASGWIGHWPDESPWRLAQMQRNGKATTQSAIWLGWVDLFRAIGPEMTGGK
jgi:hypothetical protein